MSRDDLFVVWGDTVSLSELIVGMLAGALAGYTAFAAALSYLNAYHSDLTRGVLMGYALLMGVCGCVVIGALAAAVFKPKRIVREEASVADTAALWRELRIDVRQEAQYLASVPPDLLAEMRRLGLLDLFIDEPGRRPDERP
jgi:uncharacterized transporter YbjL